MAKDKFINSQITEIQGSLDKTSDGNLVVYVEQKDEAPLEVDIVQVLEDSIGKQISCKLVYEQVM